MDTLHSSFVKGFNKTAAISKTAAIGKTASLEQAVSLDKIAVTVRVSPPTWFKNTMGKVTNVAENASKAAPKAPEGPKMVGNTLDYGNTFQPRMGRTNEQAKKGVFKG